MARKEKPMNGLRVDVRNNNIEFALKKFKTSYTNVDIFAMTLVLIFHTRLFGLNA